MFCRFGFVVIVAVVVNGIAADRTYRETTERSRIWTMFSTPPTGKKPLPPTSEKTDTVIPRGETVVVGYKPVYGFIEYGSGEAPEFSADWDFKCPQRFGFYRYERNCDIYVECRNFKANRKVCPDGMHFKDSPRWTEYPCAYPPEAQCLVREFAQPARPTAECPHQFGNYPISEQFPQHDRCNSYISCSAGVAYVMNCTFGLVFNPAINLCDWPEKVPGCHDTSDFRCPAAHLGEEDMVVNYRYPNDPECRSFYSCLNGRFRLLACDEGLLFDYRIGRCVEYDSFFCDNGIIRVEKV